jgi:restriction endonuclease-like protein
MAALSFAEKLKKDLIEWAADASRKFKGDGKHDWVLADRTQNYFDPAWTGFILRSKMHRWGHALNSSQAFAVNLFGPARKSEAACLELWRALTSDASSKQPQRVELAFEYGGPSLPPLGRTALGERRQTTQIDVALRAQFAGGKARFLLIEVKLSESSFGACRGAKEVAKQGGSDCNRLSKILARPDRKCWLAKNEGRKYWPVIQSGPRGLRFSSLADEPCPWKGGLYQLMRNWAFGQALVQTGNAEDFHVGVCIHPNNSEALALKEPIGGTSDLIAAFDKFVSKGRVIRVDPERVVGLLAPFADVSWTDYVRKRYKLNYP